MKTARGILSLVVLLVLSRVSDVRADGFVLLESYPAPGQVVTAADLVDNRIYLKFNHPVDRSSVYLLAIISRSENFRCQLTVCGAVHFEEDDTKVVWQPESFFRFGPGYFFEIRTGSPDDPATSPLPPVQRLLRDTSGNFLAPTSIDFSVDACQPVGTLKVTERNAATIHCNSSLFPYTNGPGYGIKLTATVSNPSCGSRLTVEGKVWLRLPDGALMSILDPFTTAHLSPGDEISLDLLDHTFVGGEPVGHYEFGLRLVNAVTGDNYSKATSNVVFGQCSLSH